MNVPIEIPPIQTEMLFVMGGAGIVLVFGTMVLRGLLRKALGAGYRNPLPPMVRANYYEIDPTYTASERWANYAALTNDAETAMRAVYGDKFLPMLRAELEEELPLVAMEPVGAITFRPGEPERLADMPTHRDEANTLEVFVKNFTREKPATRPMTFLGGAGRGKTTIARIFANEARIKCIELGLAPGLFIEAYGGDIETSEDLDPKIRLASSRPGSVVFIDEVHSMPRKMQEKLYMLLDRDARYLYDGDEFPTALGPFTCIFATTERGLLSEPMRMRSYIFDIKPVPAEELFRIAMNQEFEVDPAAAQTLVDRTKWDGSVRPIVNFLDVARDWMRARGGTVVAEQDVMGVLNSQGIDAMGLFPIDRQLLRTLLGAGKPARVKKGEPPRTVYQLSEPSLLGAARLDKIAYHEEVKPRLMSRGFLWSLSTGQTLTDAGVAYARAMGPQ